MPQRKKRLIPKGTPPVPKGEVEVVVYQDPRKRRKDERQTTLSGSTGPSATKFDFQKARHEVFKFGVSGMGETEQKDAKTALAVRLGARPPKNQYVNYKVLMEGRRKEKEQEKLLKLEAGHDRFSSALLNQPKGIEHSAKKKDKKKDLNAPKGGLDYQVGKFKGGVLKVNTKKLSS